MKNLRPASQLFIIVGTSLVIQTFLRFHGKDGIIWESFRYLNLGMQVLIPLWIWKLYWGRPLSKMGLRLPEVTKRFWIVLTVVLIILPIAVSVILQDDSYLSYYRKLRNTLRPPEDRLFYFAKFTISTIPGWELLHRGFLLFGIFEVTKRLQVKEAEGFAKSSAILWVTCFEAIYHFIKPELEAWGMLVFAPMLCYIALRTKSILIPLILHLYVEFLFILYMVYF